jgi:hypothetical protein
VEAMFLILKIYLTPATSKKVSDTN